MGGRQQSELGMCFTADMLLFVAMYNDSWGQILTWRSYLGGTVCHSATKSTWASCMWRTKGADELEIQAILLVYLW
jgi:hypothetical protein